MKLIFICPENHKPFESDDFKVIEDRGIKTSETGRKVWDAKVELSDACPFCGKIHVYYASELPCPFA